MQVKEICEKVRSGEIVLDEAGHRTNVDIERFLARYDEDVAAAAGRHDGTWNHREGESVESVDAGMREFYQSRLDLEIPQEGPLLSSMEPEFCFGCGERLYWVLTGNKLQLRNTYKEGSTHKEDRFVNYPTDYVCPYHKPQPTRGEITITNRLVFANFFREIEDAPEDKKYNSEWSLNHLAGRKRITEYKAEHNVAYGQMGNMSIGVYVNQAKDAVIIGPAYHPAEMGDFDSDEEYEAAMKLPVFPGYEMVGEIILDVWRWEATDVDTLGDKYPEVLKDHQDRGLVEVNVPHGKWCFEHYYDTIADDSYLYAKLWWTPPRWIWSLSSRSTFSSR